MEPIRPLILNLTDSQRDTLDVTLEIAVGQAKDTLIQHHEDDGPNLLDPIDEQARTFALQMDLVESAQSTLDDLTEIKRQVEEQWNDGS